MAHERLTNAALPRALADVTADLADLVQKEIRLARAEIGAKISTKLQAGAWLSAAGVLALIAGLLLVQALVFGIASFGIALHWSFAIVAAVFAIAGIVAYLKGKADAREELMPKKTIHQIRRDVTTVKEQFQ